MPNQSSPTPITKFYLTKTVGGAQEGVYAKEELKNLPKSALPFVTPLAVAASLGYVEYDKKADGHIDTLEIFSGKNPNTSKQKTIRGVKEGLVEAGEFQQGATPKPQSGFKKLTNKLRDELQEKKNLSAEESLKAKIAAAKAASKKGVN